MPKSTSTLPNKFAYNPGSKARFHLGLRDGLAIGLGYYVISIAFGIYCVKGGLPPLMSVLISLTNLTSSGQFAGVQIILSAGSLLEIAVTVLLVNLRYLLMSLSLTQKLAPSTAGKKRMIMGFGMTDEIYAVAMRQDSVTFAYFCGLMLLPILAWSGGTLSGALIGEILPPALQSAFGIALYSMFIAIIVPVARQSRPIAAVEILAAVCSVALLLLPWTKNLQAGWKIIICTLIAAALGATFWPFPEEDEAYVRPAKKGERKKA